MSVCAPSGAAGGGDSDHRAGDGQHGHIFREAATEWQDDKDGVPNHFIQQVERDQCIITGARVLVTCRSGLISASLTLSQAGTEAGREARKEHVAEGAPAQQAAE